jgi:hypothetical protein
MTDQELRERRMRESREEIDRVFEETDRKLRKLGEKFGRQAGAPRPPRSPRGAGPGESIVKEPLTIYCIVF